MSGIIEIKGEEEFNISKLTIVVVNLQIKK